MTYPLPSYAASIWLSSDEIHLAFPSPLDAPSHVVKFPANERGLALALAILRERSKIESATDALIGTKAAPVQYDVEEMYRQITASPKFKELEAKKAVSEMEKKEATEFLAELGL